MWSTIFTAAETTWAWLPALTIGLKFATATLSSIAAAVSLGRRRRHLPKNPTTWTHDQTAVADRP
jgi:hypothetical protein